MKLTLKEYEKSTKKKRKGRHSKKKSSNKSSKNYKKPYNILLLNYTKYISIKYC